MAFDDTLPLVRFAGKILYANRDRRFVAAYDCRIFMPLSDGGHITIGSEQYPLNRFGLFYIPPATPYCIESDSLISLIVINFDFSRRYAEEKALLPLVAPEVFDPLRMRGDVPASFFEPITGKRMEMLEPRLTEIIKETAFADEGSERMASLLLAECLLVLARMRMKPTTDKENALADAALAFIEEHATEKNCEEALCTALAYHPYYINRIFKKRTGETVHSYVLRSRVRTAAALLRAGVYKNEEIAAMVGLPNPAHFAKTFRHYMGVTPSAYRKSPPAL